MVIGKDVCVGGGVGIGVGIGVDVGVDVGVGIDVGVGVCVTWPPEGYNLRKSGLQSSDPAVLYTV